MNRTMTIDGMEPEEVARQAKQAMQPMFDSVSIQRVGNVIRARVDGSSQMVEAKPTQSGTEATLKFGTPDVSQQVRSALQTNSTPTSTRRQTTDTNQPQEPEPTSGIAEYDGDDQRPQTQSTTETSQGGQLGQVHKPFSKQEAGYVSPSDPEHEDSHIKCHECAHYDNNGHCTIVPNINPNGYCKEFHADVGVFGHAHEGSVKNNLYIYGEDAAWSMQEIRDFTQNIKDKLTDYFNR